MRNRMHLVMSTALLLVGATVALGQYSVSWWTVDGGGALRSSGGAYQLSGTIGQPDAGVMAGGSYQLSGGFWPGVPNLPHCIGDANCDGVINWHDIDYFVDGLNDNVTKWMGKFPAPGPSCDYYSLDTNQDGHVNWRDIDPFVWSLNHTCP